MLRPILLAGAAMMTLPALAQTTGTTTTANTTATTGTTTNTNPNPATTTSSVDPTAQAVHTTTNDHASSAGENTQGSTAAGIYTQVDGGVTSSATGTPGAAASATTNTEANVQAGQSGTMTDTSMSANTQAGTTTDPDMMTDTMSGQAGTMSTTNTGTTAQADTGMWNNMAGQRMSWNFAGDLGELGSDDWGVDVMQTAYAPAASGSMQTGASAGMGGPEDINASWATYAKSGAMLTPLEFGTWVLDAHGHNVTQQISGMADNSRGYPLTDILNVTAGAFTAADMNGDWRVSREELTSFMGA